MNPDLRSYHWTDSLKDAFLHTLAHSGNVRRASAAVGKSPRAAYNLRRRKDGTTFALAWDAALLVAYERVGDEILAHALEPVGFIGTPHPVTRRIRWRRAEPALGRGMGLAVLKRLDRSYDRIMRDRRRAQAARRIMCELWQNIGVFSVRRRPPAAPSCARMPADGILHRAHDPAPLAATRAHPYLRF